MSKPILCLDFDGVIHSYKSGWKGAAMIPDPPVDGAMKFIWDASEHFTIAVFSSRTNQPGGLSAMKSYVQTHFKDYWGTHVTQTDDIWSDIQWPTEKPAAFLTIDDRALTFDGTWPRIEDLKAFQPWNKKPFGPTGDFPKGKVGEDDEGGIQLGIAWDGKAGIVRIVFGKKISWLGMEPPEAINFAKAILAKAGAKKIEIEL